jgi:hypothetical protein
LPQALSQITKHKQFRHGLLKRMSAPKWGKPMQLFNAKDLGGWKMSDPNATPTWNVENGTPSVPGMVLNLSLMPSLKISKCTSNSIAHRDQIAASTYAARYELQIEDDPEPEGPTMRTGGVYGFLAPSPEQPRRPGEWQTYDITLVGRVVTVVQNGKTITKTGDGCGASTARAYTACCSAPLPCQRSDPVLLFPLIPLIPFSAELERIRETIETVAEDLICL